MYRTVVGIEGMACGHCELAVKEAITKTLQVKSAKASMSKRECVILSESPLKEEDVHRALDPTGYGIVSFECAPYEKKGFFSR